MGSSKNKLFVASHKLKGKEDKLADSKWESGILNMCSKIAERCNGNLFFCFIAHPKDWCETSVPQPSVHEWTGGWKSL